MLTIQFERQKWNQSPNLWRRDFLRVGTLSLGGLSLADHRRANANQPQNSIVRDRSVVLLYLSGGASHIETFDPKMTAPVEARSMTGEVATTVPGLTFGGTFPKLAQHAHRMAIVRSYQHSVADHVKAHVHVLTGGTDESGSGKQGFSMGSMIAKLRGASHPQTGFPTFSVLTAPEVDGQYKKELDRVLLGSHPRSLGQAHAPFQLGDQSNSTEKSTTNSPASPGTGSLAADLQLNLPAERFGDRRLLLQQLDQFNRQLDTSGQMVGFDSFHSQAIDLVLGGAAKAFDWRQESAKLIERYSTHHIQVGHKQFRPSTLGQQMLLARRLCEAGCGFVTVHSAGWDMHADGNNPGILLGMERLGNSVDIAVSAFLEDVSQRGLSDKILLVITGDFGRTPKVNDRGGRDHWPKLCTLALAGGGLPMGQVIGKSTRTADAPESTPYNTPNLMATIMHSLFDIGQLRLRAGVPNELMRAATETEPIRELV